MLRRLLSRLLGVRLAVLDFATDMERTLQRNDHKGDFYAMTAGEVLALLQEERAELDVELAVAKNPERLQLEAVDEANAAMFAWLKAGGSLAVLDRGRRDVF